VSHKSDKKKKIDANLRRIYEQYLEDNSPNCYCCGVWSGRMDFSHLVPRNYSIALQDHPDNVVLKCRSCHNRWEDNDKTMPKYEELMDRVRILDVAYYNYKLNR